MPEVEEKAIDSTEKKVTPAKTEVSDTSGFAGKSFTHNGKKYGFNMPVSEFMDESGKFIPYTYEEVLEDKNLQKNIAELCDAGETFFIKPLK